MRPFHYILDPNGHPVPVEVNKEDGTLLGAFDRDALLRWAEFMEEHRQLAETEIGGSRVCTVFLGVDHNHSFRGPPVLWETMVFSDLDDKYPVAWDIQWRYTYTSQGDAIRGHGEVVDDVRRRLAEAQAMAEKAQSIAEGVAAEDPEPAKK